MQMHSYFYHTEAARCAYTEVNAVKAPHSSGSVPPSLVEFSCLQVHIVRSLARGMPDTHTALTQITRRCQVQRLCSADDRSPRYCFRLPGMHSNHES
jgi:hypothetical protein